MSIPGCCYDRIVLPSGPIHSHPDGRRRVCIRTPSIHRGSTLLYAYQFSSGKTQTSVPLLSRRSHGSSELCFAERSTHATTVFLCTSSPAHLMNNVHRNPPTVYRIACREAGTPTDQILLRVLEATGSGACRRPGP